MNDQELKSFWKSQPLDAETVALETIRCAANAFHATILRRNRQETFAACLVILIFGVFAWIQDAATMRTGCVLIIAGTLVMLYQLRKRAGNGTLPAQALGNSYLDYLRKELVHQHQAARAIWLWGIAPVVPGVAVLIWGMAENDPSGFPWLPMLALVVVPFGVVLWMNLKVAHRMQRKIDELDAGGN